MFEQAVKTATATANEDASTTLNGIPAAEIRTALDRVLSSRVFVHSHRIRRFLQFVVEECLLGQQHRLKEYLIGLEVFNRREAFDPRVDSIVRVEARRLRAKLDEYYLSEGREDELRIQLRKGSYVPGFEYRRAGSSGNGASSSHSQRRSIAIAPFSVVNGTSDRTPLLEEVRRRLTHVLIKEGYFQVIPQPGNGAAEDLQTLGIPKPDYIVEGSLELHAGCLRVLLQLFHVAGGSYVWSESGESQEDDLTIVGDLSRALNRELMLPNSGASRRGGANRQSYDSYLKGRYCWKLATPDSIRASVTCFNQAIEMDENYAAAWAALSEALAVSSMFGFEEPGQTARVREAASRAVALDDGLPEAHIATGTALSILDWDWSGGERELQRAIQLDPRDPTAHVVYGMQLACRGSQDAALAEVERALALDPASLFPNFVLGWLHGACGRFDEAISQHRLVAHLAPDFALSYLGLGWAYVGKRMYQDAIAHFTNASNLLKCRPLLRGCLGHCYALANRRDEALRELSQLNAEAQSQYASPVSFASIYCGLGDKQRALGYLEQAVEYRDSSLPVQLMSPEFESLRGEPRFRALREKTGLNSGVC